MQYHSSLKLLAAALIVSSGALVSGAAAADEVNMWDGAWRFDGTIYAWVPWVYTTVQLPPAAGGGGHPRAGGRTPGRRAPSVALGASSGAPHECPDRSFPGVKGGLPAHRELGEHVFVVYTRANHEYLFHRQSSLLDAHGKLR